MQGNGDIGKGLEIEVEEVGRNASDNGLMANNQNRMLLPFNPVNEWLQSANGIDIGLSRWIPEVKFFILPFLEDFRMFIEYFLVG